MQNGVQINITAISSGPWKLSDLILNGSVTGVTVTGASTGNDLHVSQMVVQNKSDSGGSVLLYANAAATIQVGEAFQAGSFTVGAGGTGNNVHLTDYWVNASANSTVFFVTGSVW